MTKDDTLARIRSVGILAVLRASSDEVALGMVGTIVAGGVTGIEITYSTPNAPAVRGEFDRISERASTFVAALEAARAAVPAR